MANTTQPARRTQQPDTPNQLTARGPEHSVNIVHPDGATLSALKVRIDRIEYNIDEIFTLILPHASSSRDSARGSTRSSSDAGDLELTLDSSVGTMMTFNRNMGEVSLRKRKRRSKEERKQTNEIRLRGACIECRSKKRQCKLEHTPSKPVAEKRGRGHPHSFYRSLGLSPSFSTQAKISQDLQVRPRLISEMPPLHGGTNDRRASLLNLNLPGPDLNGFSSNRRAHGVHKSPRPSVPLAHQAQASSSTDIHQDQPSMILPRQSCPLCSEPYLDVHHCRGAVSSQFVSTAGPTPYPPDPKVFHEYLLSPSVEGYMNYSQDYVTYSGSPTNIAFNPYDESNGDWLHLDDSHRVQGMHPPYHDGFCRDRSWNSHSTHQTQETTTLTCTQDFGCVPRKNPRLLQARLQKSENADPKAPAGNSPVHQAVDLSPIESSTDRSPLPLQSSGHPVSSQGFPTHSRGSSSENPGVDWDEGLVIP